MRGDILEGGQAEWRDRVAGASEGEVEGSVSLHADSDGAPYHLRQLLSEARRHFWGMSIDDIATVVSFNSGAGERYDIGSQEKRSLFVMGEIDRAVGLDCIDDGADSGGHLLAHDGLGAGVRNCSSSGGHSTLGTVGADQDKPITHGGN